MRSLFYHSSLRDGIRNDPLTKEQVGFIKHGVIEMTECYWELPEDFLTFEHYKRVVCGSLKWNSSPGYPYMLRFPDNRCFFSVVDGQPSAARLLDVWNQVQLRLQHRTSDPIYLFVKQEPHKITKLHRKRLISSVSVIDQIIDHMLFDEFNEGLVSKSWLGPVKVGWTPLNGGWKTFPKGGVSIDKSAWDWTMQPWLFELLLQLRLDSLLTVGERRQQWEEFATWRYRSLFSNPEFVLPDGQVIKQLQGGVMKSGSVLTITDNSLAQLLLHLRVVTEMYPIDLWSSKIGWIWALGDDTRQSMPDDLRQYLSKLGEFCLVKECTQSPEFAGMRFLPGGRLEPLYKGKHAFNLLYASPRIQEDLTIAYSLLYHRSVDKVGVRRILTKFGTPPVDEFLDHIYDGE